MGCFLKCFGGSKDANRRKKRSKVNPRNQRHGVQDPPQSIVSVVHSTLEAQKYPVSVVPELPSETVEQLSPSRSPSPRKRVTFNSNVTTYEPVLVNESTDSLVDANKVIKKENEKSIVKSRKENSVVSDDESCVSSVGSYPQNHRYHNYGGSDDEAEEFGDSDLEDEDEDEDEDDDYDEDEDDDYDDVVDGRMVGEVWSESISTATMESRTEKSLKRVSSEEVNSLFLPEQETKAMGARGGYVRDRSVYVHPVLNPVENLSQWKAVKSKGKENKTANVEAPRSSFTTEPSIKQSSASFNPKSKQEVTVDASLSNWLVSPEKSESQGSVISFEDRPILGALTVEELKVLSATSTPRKSPCRSPEDRPIIGSVGAYWK